MRGEGGSEHPRVEIKRNKVTQVLIFSVHIVHTRYLDRSIYPPEY